MTDHRVERAIRAAKPQDVVEQADARLFDIAHDTIKNTTTTQGTTPMRTSSTFFSTKKRKLIGLAVSAAVVLTPAVGYAGFVGARTGWFGNPNHSETDGSEFLNMCSPETPEIIKSKKPTEGALPPFTSWEKITELALARNVGACEHWGEFNFQESGIDDRYRWYAVDAWRCHALALHDAGKAAEAKAAAEHTMPYWDYLKKSDALGGDWSKVINAPLVGDWESLRNSLQVNESCTDFAQ